jgi:L-ascorbate metabolism protein UlaG (beta-lactamase superfamily)
MRESLRSGSRFLFYLCTSAMLGACAPPRATAPVALVQRATEPIALTYLGAAGYQLEGAGRLILADPYFSRPALSDGPMEPDLQAIAARAPQRADLIVVGHSHVDHLLDVPAVAKHTGATMLGSLSSARVARASGLPDTQIITVKGGEDFAMDGFSVRVIPSLHSALEHKHAFGKEIAEPVTLPMAFDDYAEGGTFAYLVRLAGHEVLVLSTANFIERELEGLRPDIAIVAPGLRHEIHDYTCRLMRVLGKPREVFVNHFDDWQGAPVDAPPSEDLALFVAEVQACSPHTRVTIPKHFERMLRD